ncbi:MAG: ATP-binding response regulator, partial [Candidatus Binatia bacterium]
NLLSNAIKFTPPAGEIRVGVTCDDSSAEITVTDTGIGIAPELLPRIFQRFEQADGSLTRRYGGLGLGLAIAQHIVTLHGGVVEAESAGENRGATFRIRLPLAAHLAPPARPGSVQPQAPAAQPERLRGVRALIVDDEVDARDLLSVILEGEGAAVAVAGSVREAIETVQHFAPDVVLTDLAMPDEDGFVLLRQLGSRQGLKRVPVLALTALAGADTRQRVLEAGFDLHLTKPIDREEVIAAVAQAARGEAAEFARERAHPPPRLALVGKA